MPTESNTAASGQGRLPAGNPHGEVRASAVVTTDGIHAWSRRPETARARHRRRGDQGLGPRHTCIPTGVPHSAGSQEPPIPFSQWGGLGHHVSPGHVFTAKGDRGETLRSHQGPWGMYALGGKHSCPIVCNVRGGPSPQNEAGGLSMQ